MKLQVRIIEENESLDEDLELLDINAMLAREEIELEEKSFEIKPLPSFTEPANFNMTLAEMSIIEATELLASGRYETAIERFQEAIRYSPNNKDYQAKLSETIKLVKLKNYSLANNVTSRLTSKAGVTSTVFTQKPSLPSIIKLDNTFSLKDTSSIPITGYLKDTQEIPINEYLKDTQEVSINETLAEMSFMEANDLLAKGDYLAAIERMREAIDYSPNNTLYINKLNSFLAESKTNKTNTLKSTKEEISNKTSKQKEIVSKTKLLKKSSRNSQDVEIETPLSVSISSRKAKTNKNNFLAIVFSVAIICIASLAYQTKSASVIQVKPSFPSNQAKLNKQQLEFEWQSVGNRFLFEIEALGKTVVKAYTEETRYKLTSSQTNTIKLNTSYKWRVIPVDFKGEPLAYKTEEKWFQVIQ